MRKQLLQDTNPFQDAIEDLLWSGSLTEEEAFDLKTPRSFTEYN